MWTSRFLWSTWLVTSLTVGASVAGTAFAMRSAPGNWVAVAVVGLVGSLAPPLWIAFALRRRLVRWTLDGSRSVVAAPPDLPGAEHLARAFRELRAQSEAQSVEGARTGELLETVLQALPDAVLAIDARDRLTFANQAAIQLLRLSATTTGVSLLGLLRDVQLPELLAAARVTGRAGPLEVESPDGRLFATGATALSDFEGLVVVLHDVSELRRLESVRREFVTNVSHELKTPLTSIKAYAETLLDQTSENAELPRRFLSQILAQADRLHRLILDMISLARIESGQHVRNIGAVDLATVAERSCEQYRTLASSREVALTCDVPSGLLVRAEEEGLGQMLDNLLDNALKYTPGGGRVSIAARCEGPQVLVEIRDTGSGIPQEHLTRIFERFYRVDRARSRELGGTGLGLSIVKHLAQGFGGSVRAQSEVGKGSTFTIQLQMAPPPPITHQPARGGDDPAREGDP